MKDKEEHYGIVLYILFFFTFSILGWIWEVGLHLFQNGEFVNRGVLFGPWLPIYGTGGIAVLFLSKKTYNRPIITFFLTMIICSIIEYFTSWYLEFTKGVRWWDYSGYFLNLNGRICLAGAIVFGLGGCLVIYYLAPKLKEIYTKVPIPIQIILCVTLISLFVIDNIYSRKHPNMGKGITDYENWKIKKKSINGKISE